MAFLTSGRLKNCSVPRSRYPIPASASACSMTWDCPLVRNSTAICAGSIPSLSIRSRMSSAMPAASCSSSAYSNHSGSGPLGRWARSSRGVAQAPGVESFAGRRAASSRLARVTTCGVER